MSSLFDKFGIHEHQHARHPSQFDILGPETCERGDGVQVSARPVTRNTIPDWFGGGGLGPVVSPVCFSSSRPWKIPSIPWQEPTAQSAVTLSGQWRRETWKWCPLGVLWPMGIKMSSARHAARTKTPTCWIGQAAEREREREMDVTSKLALILIKQKQKTGYCSVSRARMIWSIIGRRARIETNIEGFQILFHATTPFIPLGLVGASYVRFARAKTDENGKPLVCQGPQRGLMFATALRDGAG